jgi:hypothetical protein
MVQKIPYLDRAVAIREELLRVAGAGELIHYEEFGMRLGIPARGPWKGVLDFVSQQETASSLPDVTLVLISKSTGWPSQVGFVEAKEPTLEQKRLAHAKLQDVFAEYCPAASVRLPFQHLQ